MSSTRASKEYAKLLANVDERRKLNEDNAVALDMQTAYSKTPFNAVTPIVFDDRHNLVCVVDVEALDAVGEVDLGKQRYLRLYLTSLHLVLTAYDCSKKDDAIRVLHPAVPIQSVALLELPARPGKTLASLNELISKRLYECF